MSKYANIQGSKNPVKKIDDEQKEAMREAVFADSINYVNKQRFGLFSQPQGTAAGETNYFQATKPRKTEEGEVITEPVHFKAGILPPGAKGRVPNAYRDFTSTAPGDPYKNPTKAGLRKFNPNEYLKGKHEKDWSMAKTVTHMKATHASSHEYLPQCIGLKKKSHRDADGEVILEPRNFYTQNPKKGRVQRRDTERCAMGGMVEYKEDDYNAQKKIISKEIKDHYQTIQTLQEGKAFYQQSHAGRHRNGNFNKITQMIGSDVPLPEINSFQKMERHRSQAQLKDNFQHDRSFKPAGAKSKMESFQVSIGKYAEWMAPDHPALSKKSQSTVDLKKGVKDEDERIWKHTYNKKGIPCKPVATNFRNLKAQFPSQFKIAGRN